MAYEIKDMSGSLFQNKDKKTDNHPDRSGTVKIEGVEYWASGWVKQDKNGQPWLSLAFKRKDKPAAQQAATPVAPRRKVGGISDALNDDIPFAAEFR